MSLPEVNPNSMLISHHTLQPPAPSRVALLAIAIIAGLGGLTAFGLGLATHTIVAIGVGGLLGPSLLIIGLSGGLRYVSEMATYNRAYTNLHGEHRVERREREEFIKECQGRNPSHVEHQIKGENYFDSAKWRAHYKVEIQGNPQIPQELLSYLDTPCPFAQQEGVKVRDTHMVVYVPEGTTLRSFQDYPKNINSAIPPPDEWRSNADLAINHRLESFNPQTTRSYWLLMTRHTIPGSKSLSSERHQEYLRQFNYEIPQVLEATISLTSEFLSSSSMIFVDNRNQVLDRTFTRCIEGVDDGFIIVGGCCPEGTAIKWRGNLGDDTGVAGVRRYPI